VPRWCACREPLLPSRCCCSDAVVNEYGLLATSPTPRDAVGVAGTAAAVAAAALMCRKLNACLQHPAADLPG